jgi:hypothetical protein
MDIFKVVIKYILIFYEEKWKGFNYFFYPENAKDSTI